MENEPMQAGMIVGFLVLNAGVAFLLKKLFGKKGKTAADDTANTDAFQSGTQHKETRLVRPEEAAVCTPPDDKNV